MKKYILILMLLATIPFSLGFWQRYNKATGKDELILISTEKEKKIGASVAKAVKKKYKEADDPLVQKRFQRLGQRIAEVCERQDLAYHFSVLKAEDEMEGYNAFALPGGYVYIFDTLMDYLGDDDEIAAVTAHEIAHINAKHTVKKLQSAYGMNALLVLAVVASQDPRQVNEAANALGQLMMAYSRQDEFEADELSVRYTKKAGFDPEGVVKSLEKLQKLRKKGPLMKFIPVRSHPYLSERIAKARAEVAGEMDFKSYINLPDSTKEGF